ncbi:MAG: PaaR repeat-containing protein [Chloroflexi bacterium]|nr:MAG: PaaR repeat-containing protein [Chloroflexota bacterium]
MPQPAARLGDMTAHGGVISGPGVPTVLIGGQPAVCVGDAQVCPMVTGLVPHVGGVILPPGSPNVLIGGRPAARVGDMTQCVGPPGAIIPPGCPTVLIGP